MHKCPQCDVTTRVARVEEKEGIVKVYRVCGNHKCPQYKQVVETEEKEQKR